MILEPDVLTTYREKMTDHLDVSNIKEAAAPAPKISTGRIAQILPVLLVFHRAAIGLMSGNFHAFSFQQQA